MKKWWIFLLSLALLLIGSVFCNQKSVQAYGTGENMTEVSTSSKRVGVRVCYEDVIDYAVVDSWYLTAQGTHEYWMIVDNGLKYSSSSYNTINTNNKIIVYPRSDSSYTHRFMLKSATFLERESDYSLITNVYQNGVKKSSITEYSFNRGKTPAKSYEYSMLQHDTLELCTNVYNSYSYEYLFYKPYGFNKSGKVAIDANGGVLSGEGKLYRTDTGNYISAFPQISYSKTGHNCIFEGWFDEKEGGKKYNVGDIVPDGKTLYAHFHISPGNFPVEYIDIVENDQASDVVLNNTTYQKTYGTLVSGEELGADKTEGAYYEGYYYDHCSFVTVDTSGTKVYRYFRPIVYEIYFDPQDGSGILQYQTNCEYNKTYMLKQNTYRKEYSVYLNLNCPDASSELKFYSASKKFLGWATEPDGEVVFEDMAFFQNLQNISGTYTLYAVWNENKISIPVVPKRSGYEFTGWSFSPYAKTGDIDLDITENTELYATWKPVNVKYHTEYYLENEEGSYELVDQYELDGVVDTEVSIEPMSEKYNGYVVDADCSKMSGVVKSDGSLVLTIYYKRNTTKINFHANGGEFENLPNTIQTTNEQMIDLPSVKGYRKNYEMDGWCADANGQGTVYELGAKIKMFSEDTVLYAHWIPVNYTVVFECKESDCKGQIQPVTVARDETFQLPECTFERVGYEFAGWKKSVETEDNVYKAGTSLIKLSEKNQDIITFYPVWTPISFRVSYDANESGNLKGKISGYVMPTNYFYDQTSLVSKDTYTVNGYHLKEWNTNADGTGTAYAPGEDLQGKYTKKQNIILYAIWEENQKTIFHITVKNEKGVLDTIQLTGSTGETLAEVLKRNYQESLAGEEVKFFYQGYEVTNTDSLEKLLGAQEKTEITLEVIPRSCTVRYITYENEEKIVTKEEKYEYQDKLVLSDSLGDVTGIAVYSDEQKNLYQIGDVITINKNMDLYPQHKITLLQSEDEKELEEYVIHGKRFVIPEPSKEGFVFSGWIDEEGENYGNGTVTLPRVVKNLLLTAHWSAPLDYTVKYDLDNDKITIIDENVVTRYSFGTTMDLPVISQLAVADGYTFVGWYLEGDINQNIITQISADMHEDIVLKAKLIKTEEDKKNEEEQKNEDTSKDNLQGDLNGENIGSNGTTSGSDNKNDDTTQVDGSNQNTSNQNSSNQNISSADSGNSTLDDGVGSEKIDITSQMKKSKNGTTFTINGYTYRVINDSASNYEVSIVKYTGKAKKVKIGDTCTYAGIVYKITKINAKSFYKNSRITSIILGKNIKVIGKQAFAGMKKLSAITIAKEVTTIGDKILYGNKMLKKVVISSKKITKIGNKMIGGTKGKVKVVVPKSRKGKYKKALKNNKLTVITK